MKTFAFVMALCATALSAQDRVRAIQAPATPLPSEAASAGVTRFSFIAYGDTRGRQDGTALQYEHSTVVDAMIAQIKRLQATDAPVKFVLQSGDAVVAGQNAAQWNVSFIPIIERLMQQANVPYFFAVGNHDVGTSTTHDAAARQAGLKNTLDAIVNLIPRDGSPRRLSGYPTYSFGYGNAFFIAIDTNLIGDEVQFNWVKAQLAGLDRARFKHVFVFCHHNVFSSGPHGGGTLEATTTELRNRYMPLFREYHVNALFTGHEHLFEHWVETYSDASGEHRMDLIVSGGGGAPPYKYDREPDTRAYLQANAAAKVRLEHVAKPGAEPGSNPHHYLLLKVDGDQVDMDVIATEWGVGYQPYRGNRATLTPGR